jgi:RNA polymerase sigma factor (sigma-70 family)
MARHPSPVVPLTPEQRQMVEDNIKFAHFIANALQNKVPFDYEELLGLCTEGLCKAARYFDPDKGKFTTIASLTIEHFVINKARDYSKHNISTVYLEDLARTEEEESEWEDWLPVEQRSIEDQIVSSIDIQRAFKRIKLTEREKTVLSLKMANPKATQETMAQIMGVSRTRIEQLLLQVKTKFQKQLAV